MLRQQVWRKASKLKDKMYMKILNFQFFNGLGAWFIQVCKEGHTTSDVKSAKFITLTSTMLLLIIYLCHPCKEIRK